MILFIIGMSHIFSLVQCSKFCIFSCYFFLLNDVYSYYVMNPRTSHELSSINTLFPCSSPTFILPCIPCKACTIENCVCCMAFMIISCPSHIFSFFAGSMIGHVLLFFLHMCFRFGVFFFYRSHMSHVGMFCFHV